MSGKTNSRKLILFFSVIVLVILSGFITRITYNMSFQKQFNMLKAYFTQQVEFFAKSISAGYFQWTEMYTAVMKNDLDFIDEQIEDIKRNYPKITRIELIEGTPPEKIYEISNDGMMMIIRLKIADDSVTKHVLNKLTVIEIPAENFLGLASNIPIRLSDDGKPFVYNLKYQRIFTINDLTSSLFFFFVVAMIFLIILLFSERRRIKAEKQSSESLERQRKSLQAINEFTQAVLRNILQPSYQYMIEKAVEIVPGAQGGSVLTREGSYFVFSGCVGYDFQQLSKVKFLPDELAQGESEDVRTVGKLEEFDKKNLRNQENLDILMKYGHIDEIKATLSVPVKVNDEVVAFLNLDNFESENAFTEDAKKVATVFANQVGVLFERIKLERELEEQKERFKYLSTHDALTGLPNRRLLLMEAEKLFSLAQRENKKICCIYMDLCGFKSVNDTYGHKVGDFLLQVIAERLKNVVRKSDIVARMGGDEFVFMLYDCKEYEQFIDRALNELESDIHHEQCGKLRISANFGVAIFPDDARNLDELFSKADSAMYYAKNNDLKYWPASDLLNSDI
ncbi:MAG TPA: sensor domain-containing diguanylate cyclase [Fervidobacterium sp.]|nr:hypothetical protein [Fervidobacterium sp.]HOK88245.1 sensor domain-containing diguanylate cyclase [Fervidobacterium sp.]HOM74279.1 sensor domain-containing diguanylate cyclase [Fervidobacterium sp.]HRD21175.1 sensor domain-containing diguanylate cyclase [Fervidobacterium sp.]